MVLLACFSIVFGPKNKHLQIFFSGMFHAEYAVARAASDQTFCIRTHQARDLTRGSFYSNF